MKASLALVLARARSAIRSQAVLDPTCGSGSILAPLEDVRPERLRQTPRSSPLGVPTASVAALCRELSTMPPMVMVRPRNPAPVLQAPSWPSCEDVLAGIQLSLGAARVFALLHRLALEVARARGYSARPDTVTLHLPASLLALGVGYTDRHLRRLLPELQVAGLVACGAHASKVRNMGLWDGYLWCIKVNPGEICPHLRREDWKHAWRDFEADIEAKRTVKALLEGMSALHPDNQENALNSALKAWAVSPGNISSPVACRPDIGEQARQETVLELAYRLGDLVHVHPTKRAEAVGRLGSSLAHALDDEHSRRWYCQLLWTAWKTEVEGRAGLGVLAAALARLDADRTEWTGLRNPAALLAARLRVA